MSRSLHKKVLALLLSLAVILGLAACSASSDSEPPADNRWVATATFSEPGTYVLRGVASDGSLFTYDNVTVTVTR